MKCLLDTHAYLWWMSEPHKLSKQADDIISDTNSDIWVSIATFWEIAIKSSLGRLTLSQDVGALCAELVNDGFKLLDIDSRHCSAVARLPFHHRDPFDRMRLAQALTDDLTLVSRDAELRRYPVKVAW
jgi:PIN domain nuclease of toxin-antitoxin system